MQGSWAGAMGHFQFMPSTFNAYAVDADGDKQIDIWHSFEDAAASAANYLSSIGWQKIRPGDCRFLCRGILTLPTQEETTIKAWASGKNRCKNA